MVLNMNNQYNIFSRLQTDSSSAAAHSFAKKQEKEINKIVQFHSYISDHVGSSEAVKNHISCMLLLLLQETLKNNRSRHRRSS